MGIILTSVKIDYPLRIFLTNVQASKISYTKFLDESIDECSEVIQKIVYNFSSRPHPFTFKFQEETLKKIDNLSEVLHTTRSDIIRRLIFAKVNKLC